MQITVRNRVLKIIVAAVIYVLVYHSMVSTLENHTASELLL